MNATLGATTGVSTTYPRARMPLQAATSERPVVISEPRSLAVARNLTKVVSRASRPKNPMSMVAEIRELARPTSSVLKKRAATIQNTKPKTACMPVLRIRERALRTMLSVCSDAILCRQPTGWDGAAGAR